VARFESKKQNVEQDNASGALAGNLATILEPTSPAAEAYRNLRTSILYGLVDAPPKVILVTSPGTGEGKSTVCANLGVTLAQAGKATLIVDCDFRKPVMHKFFGLSSTYGLVNVLAGERDLEHVCQEPVPGLCLRVVTVGALPPNPAELLGSRRLFEFLANAREKFDYVLLDSPPAGLVADPVILAAQGDGVLLTLDAQKTRKGEVRKVMRRLNAVGATVLGTVMNKARGNKDGYYAQL
jgi:capsular exopolysaccharide synthesis family protein